MIQATFSIYSRSWFSNMTINTSKVSPLSLAIRPYKCHMFCDDVDAFPFSRLKDCSGIRLWRCNAWVHSTVFYATVDISYNHFARALVLNYPCGILAHLSHSKINRLLIFGKSSILWVIRYLPGFCPSARSLYHLLRVSQQSRPTRPA